MRPSGIRRLFRFTTRGPADIDQDIRDEFAFHLEMRTADLVREGLADTEARAQAEAEFGDRARGLARCHDAGAVIERRRFAGRFIAELRQDTRYGLRLLTQSPGFTTAAILTLAVAIGGNTAVFSIVNALLLKAPAVGAPATLSRIHAGGAGMSWPNYEDLRTGTDVFAQAAAFTTDVLPLGEPGAATRVIGESVTPNYFGVLGVPAMLGRPLLESDTRTDIVVLGERLWRLRFGADPAIVGRRIPLGRRAHEVVGVMPAAFRGMAPPGLVREFWIPLDTSPANPRLQDRLSHQFNAVGRLRPGLTRVEAAAVLRVAAARIRAAHPTLPETFTRVQVAGVSGPEAYRGAAGALMPVFLFIALLAVLAGLVLLIGCANIAGLLLGRAAERRREIAVRLAMGASRGRLVRQLLTESLLLALAGGAAGTVLAVWLAGLVNVAAARLPFPMEFDLGIDTAVLAYAIGLSLVTALLFGLAPARRASRLELVPALRDESSSTRRQRARQALVIAQVATCSILLAWGLLFARSLGNVSRVDPGFDHDGVLLAHVSISDAPGMTPARREGLFIAIQDGARELPWVEAAGLAWMVPLSLTSRENFAVAIDHETPREASRRVVANRLSPGWFDTVRIPVLAGRDFTPDDRAGAPEVAIVNETLARRFWNGQALGQRLRFTGRRNALHDAEVIGIVADSKYWTLGEAIEPAVYLPFRQSPIGEDLTLHVRTRDAALTAAALGREILRLAPDSVVEMQPMSDAVAVSLLPARIGAGVTAAFGAIAVLLSTMGVYGLVAFSVSQRTRELGIRRALGAPTASVLRLVVGHSLALVWGGLALGLALGIAGGRALEGLIVGVSPADPLTLAAVAVLVTAAALASSAVPAMRAARVDPVSALRGTGAGN